MEQLPYQDRVDGILDGITKNSPPNRETSPACELLNFHCMNAKRSDSPRTGFGHRREPGQGDLWRCPGRRLCFRSTGGRCRSQDPSPEGVDLRPHSSRGLLRDVQALEPDLQRAQSDILWAQHLVIVYPVWWGSVPALLKGFLDRVFHPGFAYRYHENDPFFDKLLTGRSGHLIATSDAPSVWVRLAYRSCDANMMKRAVLQFCGISPVGLTRMGRIRGSSLEYRTKGIERIRALGERQGAPFPQAPVPVGFL